MSEAQTESDTSSQDQASSDTEQAPDLAAEVDKWKSLARKHEERAKLNANASRELESFRQASLTDQERAVEAAKAETRSQTLLEVGGRLVDAEFRASIAGRLDKDQTQALLDGLDRSKFLDDDGNPDADKVAAFVGRIASTEERPAPAPDLGQGRRSTSGPRSDMNSLIRRAAGAGG